MEPTINNMNPFTGLHFFHETDFEGRQLRWLPEIKKTQQLKDIESIIIPEDTIVTFNTKDNSGIKWRTELKGPMRIPDLELEITKWKCDLTITEQTWSLFEADSFTINVLSKHAYDGYLSSIASVPAISKLKKEDSKRENDVNNSSKEENKEEEEENEENVFVTWDFLYIVCLVMFFIFTLIFIYIFTRKTKDKPVSTPKNMDSISTYEQRFLGVNNNSFGIDRSIMEAESKLFGVPTPEEAANINF